MNYCGGFHSFHIIWGQEQVIGYKQGNCEKYVQSQAIAKGIQEAMMKKMDIKKQKARKKSKTEENQETRDRVYERKWT